MELDADLDLILANCRKFNQEVHPENAAVVTICEKLIRDCKSQFDRDLLPLTRQEVDELVKREGDPINHFPQAQRSAIRPIPPIPKV